MYFIHDKEEYYFHITRFCKTEEEKRHVLEKAYEVALDTRKFEISLYWKRATYFWGFIGAIFIAYFALVGSENFAENRLLTIPLSLIGIAFSLGWYFVNRGSKLWQENWETNIGFLEEYINGPLFKSVVVPNLRFKNITRSFPYSVSRVNITLSFITTLFWSIIFLYSLLPNSLTKQVMTKMYNIYSENFILYIIIIFVAVIVVFFLGVIYHTKSLSFIKKDLSNSNKEKKENEEINPPRLYYRGEAPSPHKQDNIIDLAYITKSERTVKRSFFWGFIKF